MASWAQFYLVEEPASGVLHPPRRSCLLWPDLGQGPALLCALVSPSCTGEFTNLGLACTLLRLLTAHRGDRWVHSSVQRGDRNAWGPAHPQACRSSSEGVLSSQKRKLQWLGAQKAQGFWYLVLFNLPSSPLCLGFSAPPQPQLSAS